MTTTAAGDGCDNFGGASSEHSVKLFAVFRAALLTILLGALVMPTSALGAPVAKKKPVRGHVVNGANTLGPLVWQVGIINAKDIGTAPFQTFCGGTLRDASHVITAAHCVPDSNAADLAVVWNLHRRSDGTNAGAAVRTVSAITSHPQYTDTSSGNDLAILTLSSAMPVGAGTWPITNANVNWTGQPAVISGWGLLFDGGPSPDTLQAATINVLPDAQCGGYGNSYDPSTMLCAGLPNGVLTVDTCQGDSGGPLVFNNGTTFPLLGVVSFGRGCADPDFPGVYTRLSNPDLNNRAKDPNPPARAEPVNGATIQGTPAAGQTLTCDPGQWNGQTGAFLFTWISGVRGADGKFSDVRSEPSGQTLAVNTGLVGRVVGCAATSVGAGGARQSGAPLVTITAAAPVAGAATTPPATVPGDLIAPTSRFTRRSCKKRRCSLTILASDSGGGATKVAVTYARLTGCRKGKKGAKCRKAKTLRSTSKGKGVFTVTTPRLAPAKYRFTVIATDTSGNRSKKTSVVLRVKR